MSRRQVLLILMVCGLVSLATAEERQRFIPVELTEKFTLKLDKPLLEGNFLTIQKGKQTLGGVTFEIGEGVIQLGSQALPTMPAQVEGIEVNTKFTELHVLHATNYGGGTNGPGSKLYVEDRTEVGAFKLHYKDGTTEVIPIVYGKDIRDWWFREDEKEPSDAKVVWNGDNDFAKTYRCRLRLYMTTWVNPHPLKKVTAIDYIGRKDKTVCAPFCVAITLKRK